MDLRINRKMQQHNLKNNFKRPSRELISEFVTFRNVYDVIYRFAEDVIDSCSTKNKIDTRKVAGEYSEPYLFIRYWLDKNQGYSKFFEDVVENGCNYLNNPTLVISSGYALFMSLVMSGKLDVLVDCDNEKILKKITCTEDLPLISCTKQRIEKNDSRLASFYVTLGNNAAFKKPYGNLHRNVRGTIDIVGEYPGVIKNFGRKISYDDIRLTRFNGKREVMP
ncbi:MAG TPA: hypothetical protein VJZ93_02690 [Candidatus Nanoarchaeia archaeon]|nr:hypothetical protein [Candidatus Nanoarchaeia archaeon]